MIIKVQDDARSGDEWDLIEFQGVFHPMSGEDLAGKVMGRLTYVDGGRCALQVGHMYVEGKVGPVLKPYVLLEKCADTETPDEAAGVSGTRYKVVGVVKRKFHFTTSRHKPPT